jgi:hypothetical protein
MPLVTLDDLAPPEHGRNCPDPIDERFGFLARASARLELVELGELDIDQAFDELIDQFLWIVFPPPENEAEAYWDAPGWREAAAQTRPAMWTVPTRSGGPTPA